MKRAILSFLVAAVVACTAIAPAIAATSASSRSRMRHTTTTKKYSKSSRYAKGPTKKYRVRKHRAMKRTTMRKAEVLK